MRKRQLFKFYIKKLVPPKILNIVGNFYYNYKFKYKQTLKKNIELRDKFFQKRCFIIANGPSINKLDLKKLKNDFVFTMNHFYFHDDFYTINPNFYSLIEPIEEKTYFNFSFFKKTIHQLDKIAQKKSNIIFLFKIQYRDYIEKNSLFRKNKVYYLKNKSNLLETKKCRDDISKEYDFMDMSLFNSIACCAYMGFKKIYLIGCDFDYLLKKENEHFYKQKTNITKNDATNLKLAKDLYLYLKKMEKTDKHFASQGVKIYNAGIGGLTDTFPRVKYNTLFK